MKQTLNDNKQWLNLLLSLVCLGWLSTQIQMAQVKHVWSMLSWSNFLAALSVPLLMSVVHVWRWQAAMVLLGASIPFALCFRLVYIGYLFNQLLPSSFGGDVIRTCAVRRQGYEWVVAVGSVLLDRIIGLFTLTALYLLFYPFLRQVFSLGALDVFWLMLGSGWLVLLLLWATRLKWTSFLLRFNLLERLSWLSCLRFDIKAIFSALLFGVIVHFGIGLSFYILAQGLEIPLSLATAVVLFPLINLITMIPLSFAGWGVREGVMMIALPYIGISAESAFALSISYGVVITVSALPGIAAWWLQPYATAKTP